MHPACPHPPPYQVRGRLFGQLPPLAGKGLASRLRQRSTKSGPSPAREGGRGWAVSGARHPTKPALRERSHSPTQTPRHADAPDGSAVPAANRRGDFPLHGDDSRPAAAATIHLIVIGRMARRPTNVAAITCPRHRAQWAPRAHRLCPDSPLAIGAGHSVGRRSPPPSIVLVGARLAPRVRRAPTRGAYVRGSNAGCP